MSAFISRPATPEDVPGLVHVAQRTWRATYGGILPEAIIERALQEWYDPKVLAERVASARSFYLVARGSDGAVVGYAVAGQRREEGAAELWAIYVLPELQQQGIGGDLLTAALAALQGVRPVERIYVQVERANAIGRAFYDRKGFQRVREYDQDIFGHQSPMVEMCLPVKPGAVGAK